MSGSTNGPGAQGREPAPIEVQNPESASADKQVAAVSVSAPQAQIVDRLAAEVILRYATGRRVLDLGGGAPRVTELVQPRAAHLGIVNAVDLGRGSQVSLSMADASYDLVYCLRTLAHLGTDEQTSVAATGALLAEIGRVLAQGGTALVGIDNPRSLWGIYHGVRNPAQAVDPGAWVVSSERGITRFDTPGRLRDMLPPTLDLVGQHGLGVVSVVPGLLHVPIVGALARRFEWFARDRAGLRGLAAHLLMVLRRRTER